MLQYLTVATLISVGYATQSYTSTDCGPLCDYIHRPDDNYGWVGPIRTYDQDGFTTYILNMTSLTWFDEELSNRHIWWHYVAVHIPDVILYPEHALLCVSASNNDAAIPLPGSYHLYETGLITNRTKMVTAVIRQIPNQPISFLGETEERTEDNIVAWTWARFLENEETETELLLHLPMTKAATRALDAVTEFVESMVPANHIDKYLVVGESKRGWTTWLMGCIDTRVIAIVPELLTCLNYIQNAHHLYQTLGGWPLLYIDYLRENITAWLDHPRKQEIMDINDPWQFREYMTVPKIMISGVNDEFQTPDDSRDFFDDLVGEKYIWMLENTGHTVSASPLYEDIWLMVETFYLAIIEDHPRPEFSWTMEHTETGCSLTMTADQTPTFIEAWWAETPEIVCEREDDVCRRDFRSMVNVPPVGSQIEWFSIPVDDLGGNVYRVELDNADDPEYYRGVFMKVRFSAFEGREYSFSTEVCVTPDRYSFDDCEGAACLGVLK